MRFCNCMEMWRKDMEEDDISNADCNGDCEGCCYCEEIKTDRERRRENERRGGITFEVIRNSDNKKFTVYDIVRTQHYTYFMIYDGGWKYIDADLFRECDKN